MINRLFKPKFLQSNYGLEYSLLVFTLLMLPITWALLDRGVLENIVLLIFILAVAIAAVTILGRFIYSYTKVLDERSIQLGALIRQSAIRYFFPLLVLKFVGYVFYQIIWMDHSGLPKMVCDLLNLIKYVYNWLYPFQTIINWAILGGLLILVVAQVWSLSKKVK